MQGNGNSGWGGSGHGGQPAPGAPNAHGPTHAHPPQHPQQHGPQQHGAQPHGAGHGYGPAPAHHPPQQPVYGQHPAGHPPPHGAPQGYPQQGHPYQGHPPPGHGGFGQAGYGAYGPGGHRDAKVVQQYYKYYIISGLCLFVLTAGPAFYHHTLRVYEVEYVVKGKGRAEVTYHHNSDSVTLPNEKLPWRLKRDLRQIRSVRIESGGDSCEIYIDGELCDREASGTWCSCYDGEGSY